MQPKIGVVVVKLLDDCDEDDDDEEKHHSPFGHNIFLLLILTQ